MGTQSPAWIPGKSICSQQRTRPRELPQLGQNGAQLRSGQDGWIFSTYKQKTWHNVGLKLLWAPAIATPMGCYSAKETLTSWKNGYTPLYEPRDSSRASHIGCNSLQYCHQYEGHSSQQEEVQPWIVGVCCGLFVKHGTGSKDSPANTTIPFEVFDGVHTPKTLGRFTIVPISKWFTGMVCRMVHPAFAYQLKSDT